MHRSAVAKAGGPRRHPNHLAISSPAGTYGTGPFLPPSFFTGATRAYKWRGISGRTRAPCGWLIARTRARHPPRHAPLPRARARARPPAAPNDGDRSDDDIGVDHPIDVSSRPVMHATVPSPHHSAADFADGRGRAVSVHAACKQLLVSWAAAGCRRPAPCARLRLCPARDRDTKALGQLFQVPVVLSRME